MQTPHGGRERRQGKEGEHRQSTSGEQRETTPVPKSPWTESVGRAGRCRKRWKTKRWVRKERHGLHRRRGLAGRGPPQALGGPRTRARACAVKAHTAAVAFVVPVGGRFQAVGGVGGEPLHQGGGGGGPGKRTTKGPTPTEGQSGWGLSTRERWRAAADAAFVCAPSSALLLRSWRVQRCEPRASRRPGEGCCRTQGPRHGHASPQRARKSGSGRPLGSLTDDPCRRPRIG